MSKVVNVLIVVLIIFAVFILGRCTLKCGKSESFVKGTVSSDGEMEYIREGYKRSPLAEDTCHNMERTPVDFAMLSPNGWQQNPQYKVLPSVRFQPLEFGPIDFYPDSRRLNRLEGVLFQQYRNDWEGCGASETSMANDTKNRSNVLDLGDLSRKQRMDDAWSPAFGPNRAQPFTDAVLSKVDPTRQKIYGGNDWLHFSRLGSN